METIYRRCAGLDVHKKSIQVCVRIMENDGGVTQQTHRFGTMTGDLLQLRDWLSAQQVTHVAMESTGVLWKPVFNILEDAYTVWVCNAQHIKQVPGRKTDVRDCQWIAQLMQHGLLQPSFVPQRALRAALQGRVRDPRKTGVVSQECVSPHRAPTRQETRSCRRRSCHPCHCLLSLIHWSLLPGSRPRLLRPLKRGTPYPISRQETGVARTCCGTPIGRLMRSP